MLLLVTILLVVVGTISLLIGYTQTSLPAIFVSIGCSVVAAALLLIFSRMTAKSQKSDSSSDPAPSGSRSDATEAVPATGTGFLGRSASPEAFAAPVPTRYDEDDDEDEIAVVASDDDFPIERYDSRRVGEILPLLAELDVDELDMVREREERGKGRATVLARIDQLIEQLEEDDRQEAEHRFDAPAPADDDDDLAEPAPAPTVSVAALPMDDDYFPIEEYDDLRTSEILPLLPELDDDELDMVRERERTGSARSSILHRIDALLDVEPAAAGPGPVAIEESPAFEPEPEPEPVFVPAAPVRKARATKAPAVRPARASAPTVKPSPAAKAPAKAAKAAKAAKVTRAVAAPPPVKATRAPAKAAPVAKAPTKKAPASRSSVPAAKTVKAASAVAKAAPAKRTAQKRTATPSSTPAAKATKKAAKR